MTESERKTDKVPLAGRQVEIKELTDAQRMLLGRWALLLSRDDVAGELKLATMDRMFSMLDKCITDDDDRAHVEEQMANGDLTLTELIHAFSTLNNGDAESAPRRVRRGRAPAKR